MPHFFHPCFATKRYYSGVFPEKIFIGGSKKIFLSYSHGIRRGGLDPIGPPPLGYTHDCALLVCLK